MNRKDEWSKQELRLKDYLLIDMESDDCETVEIDLSFLSDESEDKKKVGKRKLRMADVAIIMILIFSLSTGLAIWITLSRLKRS